MKKPRKSATKTIDDKKASKHERVISTRKNTSPSTRAESRQRSGGNDPQHGSH